MNIIQIDGISEHEKKNFFFRRKYRKIVFRKPKVLKHVLSIGVMLSLGGINGFIGDEKCLSC